MSERSERIMNRVLVRPKVLLVDDHRLLAQGLALALEHEGLEVEIAEVEDIEAIVEDARRFRPDVVVLDLVLGDLGSGLDLIGPLRDAGSGRVLMLTGVTEHVPLAACLEAGAVGVTSKSNRFEQVVAAVLAAVRGAPVMREADRLDLLRDLEVFRTREQETRAPFETLTRREQEVLQGLLDGKSLHEIARESFVGPGTVRCQAKAVFRKLGVNSQIGAVAAAHRARWSLTSESLSASPVTA